LHWNCKYHMGSLLFVHSSYMYFLVRSFVFNKFPTINCVPSKTMKQWNGIFKIDFDCSRSISVLFNCLQLQEQYPCLLNSLICIFFKTYETDDCSSFIPFHFKECSLIDFKFLFYSHSIIFHFNLLGLCSALRVFEQEWIFIVRHLLWHGVSVFPVSSGGPPQSVASYDSQGDVEDLF
jgi:hypothetical protein